MSKPFHNRALRGLPFFIAAVTLGFAAACGNKGGGSATVSPPMQAKPEVLAQNEFAGSWAAQDERNLEASKRFRGAGARAYPSGNDQIFVKVSVAMAYDGDEQNLTELTGEATITPMKRAKISIPGHSDKVFQATCLNKDCDRLIVRLIEKNDTSAPEVEDEDGDNQPKAWTQNVSKYGQVVMIFSRSPKPSDKPQKIGGKVINTTRRETQKATDPNDLSAPNRSNEERQLNLEWTSPSEKGKSGGLRTSFVDAMKKTGKTQPGSTTPAKEQQPQGNASNVTDPNSTIKLGENPPAGESAAQRKAREQAEAETAKAEQQRRADEEAAAERQRQTDAANAKSRGETTAPPAETTETK